MRQYALRPSESSCSPYFYVVWKPRVEVRPRQYHHALLRVSPMGTRSEEYRQGVPGGGGEHTSADVDRAERSMVAIREGHVLEILQSLPQESIHAIVTSPPYVVGPP